MIRGWHEGGTNIRSPVVTPRDTSKIEGAGEQTEIERQGERLRERERERDKERARVKKERK